MANNLTLTSTSNNELVADAAAEGLLALFGNPADTTPVWQTIVDECYKKN